MNASMGMRTEMDTPQTPECVVKTAGLKNLNVMVSALFLKIKNSL